MSEKRKEIERKVDQLSSGHKEAGEEKKRSSSLRITKRGIPLLPALIIMVAVALLVSAVLLSLISGFQEQTIDVEGSDPLVLFDGDPLYFDLAITEDITSMTNGQYTDFSHTLEDIGKSFCNIHFDIDDSWFTVPTDAGYGLEYGVIDNSDNQIDDILLFPGQTEYIKFWFETDEAMMNGQTTTTITLTGTEVNPFGESGLSARYEVENSYPVFSDYKVTMDSVELYSWNHDPSADMDNMAGWSTFEDSVWNLRYEQLGNSDDIYILPSILDTDPFTTDLVINSNVMFDHGDGSRECHVKYDFYFCRQDTDNYFKAWMDDQTDECGIDWVIAGSSYLSVTETGISYPGTSMELPVAITMTGDMITLDLDGTIIATLNLS